MWRTTQKIFILVPLAQMVKALDLVVFSSGLRLKFSSQNNSLGMLAAKSSLTQSVWKKSFAWVQDCPFEVGARNDHVLKVSHH